MISLDNTISVSGYCCKKHVCVAAAARLLISHIFLYHIYRYTFTDRVKKDFAYDGNLRTTK